MWYWYNPSAELGVCKLALRFDIKSVSHRPTERAPLEEKVSFEEKLPFGESAFFEERVLFKESVPLIDEERAWSDGVIILPIETMGLLK
ncbi:hypothetical protein A1QI_07115 [Vibrio genomosp. F10 str. 9ZB36]|nr:hypothetical protein A1QK_20755 [Vibrio genomosp. F10 str. 9ZD137]OEF06034.1 hypothetical protein A1QI_07115 [Vibrio genomosp. F10 str. 9ZB36]